MYIYKPEYIGQALKMSLLMCAELLSKYAYGLFIIGYFNIKENIWFYNLYFNTRSSFFTGNFA